MQKINLSIIIPVFNLEHYITNCLETVFNQDTSYTYEVIVIDDGSTDNSTLKIKEFSRKLNIKIFYFKNKGPSATRNFGLTQSLGEYISFIDGDDSISPKFVEQTLNKAYLEKSDMVIFGIMRVEDGVSTPFYLPMENSNLFSDVVDYAFAWNKIYKRELISDFFFIEGIWYEDFASIPILFMKASKVSILSQYLYFYLSRRESITNSIDNPLILNYIDALINVNTYIQELPESDRKNKLQGIFEFSKNKAKNNFLLRMLPGYSRGFIIKELRNIVLKFKVLGIWSFFDWWKIVFSFLFNKDHLKKILKRLRL